MNRGGLAGTSFEIDDRFTAYDADAIETAGFQGGKMLVRIEPEDAATAPTLQACAGADQRAGRARQLMAMVEPFISHRVDGRVRNDLTDRGGHPLVDGCRRARPHVGSYLAQASSRRRDGRGTGCDDASGAAARRRGRRPTRTRSSPSGPRRWPIRMSAAWSWGARCSTRQTATWPRPSTRPWRWSDVSRAALPRASRRTGRTHRSTSSLTPKEAEWVYSGLRVLDSRRRRDGPLRH